tara:strand:+ start:1343 stop:1594 length:252 start_codon:yes stop_codon:yes gene_type:complete
MFGGYSERLNYLSLAWDYKRIALKAHDEGNEKLAKAACLNAIRAYEGCNDLSEGDYISDALKLAKLVGIESEISRLEKLLEDK